MDKYDGLTIEKAGNIQTTTFCMEDALNQDNPRNVFLNGQLFIEMICNHIIQIYFETGNGLKNGVMGEFLSSGRCSYSTKIRILKMLLVLESETNPRPIRVVGPKLIASLEAIGNVRNAFHHNLEYGVAMNKVRKGGKFIFVNKHLSEYQDLKTLVEDFKKEALQLRTKLMEKLNTINMDNEKRKIAYLK